MPEVTADGRPLIKCTSCKAFRLTEEFENDKFGQKRKTCLMCKIRREEKKCFHQRRKNECKDCGGTSMCIHQRRKRQCIDCGGSQICEHNKRRSNCFKCDPSSALWHRANIRIINAIGSKIRAGRTTEQLLGCDKKTFFNHIESLFKEGMSWDNIQLIDIDHIVPIKYRTVNEPTLNEMIQRFH